MDSAPGLETIDKKGMLTTAWHDHTHFLAATGGEIPFELIRVGHGEWSGTWYTQVDVG